MELNKIIRFIQIFAVLLIFIGSLIGFFQEIYHMIEIRKIQLADLLLLFIYVEVMGMIRVYLLQEEIRITYPLIIAITAISRLIILQKKDLDPAILIYESVAILILAVAIIVLKMRYINFFKEDKSNDKN
jgi:protein PsiE